ncbi:MAG: hypothetical protein U1F65_00765 [Verrucomicrobiota bacterium]
MNGEQKNLWKGLLLGSFLGIAMQIGGYFLVRGDRSEFGCVMFSLVPVVSGFVVAAIVRKPKRILACCLVGGVVTFSLMFTLGLEGIICCFMASPLVAIGVTIGAFLGYHARGRVIDKLPAPGKTTLLLLLLCPLLIAAADRIERPFRQVQQHETFTSETVLTASPERTWELVARMKKLDGKKPFLLWAGLPTATSCELDRSAVGGKRICHFDNGIIAQEVTDWQPPKFMGLKITESTLPGRHWLTFIDASYELIPEGSTTRLIRHTTIGTKLYPRWYWRPLERWGVTSEHEFVFSNLHQWTESK